MQFYINMSIFYIFLYHRCQRTLSYIFEWLIHNITLTLEKPTKTLRHFIPLLKIKQQKRKHSEFYIHSSAGDQGLWLDELAPVFVVCLC